MPTFIDQLVGFGHNSSNSGPIQRIYGFLSVQDDDRDFVTHNGKDFYY